MSDTPVTPPERTAYEHRLAEIVASLGQTEGVTGLNALIDQAVGAAETAHPAFRCRQGCCDCCEFTMPVVTASEWRLLHAAIAAKPEAFQKDLHARTVATYRQQVDALGVLAARLRGLPAFIQGVDDVDMAACALLADGKCSTYEARPAMCRAYGYMTLVEDNAITPVMCPPAVQHIIDTFPEDHLLPRWEPFQAALNRLTRKEGIAHLPLWIMAQHDLGGYMVPPIDDPLTWTVKRMNHSILATDPPPPPPDPADTTVGRPKVDQGLGLALGRPAVKAPTFGFAAGVLSDEGPSLPGLGED
jgi:Fe-S-cluster containining protein